MSIGAFGALAASGIGVGTLRLPTHLSYQTDEARARAEALDGSLRIYEAAKKDAQEFFGTDPESRKRAQERSLALPATSPVPKARSYSNSRQANAQANSFEAQANSLDSLANQAAQAGNQAEAAKLHNQAVQVRAESVKARGEALHLESTEARQESAKARREDKDKQAVAQAVDKAEAAKRALTTRNLALAERYAMEAVSRAQEAKDAKRKIRQAEVEADLKFSRATAYKVQSAAVASAALPAQMQAAGVIPPGD